MDDSDAKAPPFASRDVLGPRFTRKTRATARGCLEWDGAQCKRVGNRPDEGQIRVRVALKQYKALSASRVAWWLAGNSWPPPGAQLQHTCGLRNCVQVAHLRLVTKEQRLKLTPQRVAEIKALYAMRVAVQREVFGRLGVTRKPSALSLTKQRAWVSRSTAERFLRGERMSPAHWMSEQMDVEELRQTLEQAGRDADDVRKKLDAVEAYSVKNLAKRYGVAMSAIGRALYSDDV